LKTASVYVEKTFLDSYIASGRVAAQSAIRHKP
jgi:hypothetical protein